MRDLLRGSKPNGCSEESLFGLYDWDCIKGIRKLGYWSHKSKCKVYCLSTQKMVPEVKQIQCRCSKKSGRCSWLAKVKGQGKVSNPDFKCVQTTSVAYWSTWSAWSDWTKCSVNCGKGNVSKIGPFQPFLISQLNLGTKCTLVLDQG